MFSIFSDGLYSTHLPLHQLPRLDQLRARVEATMDPLMEIREDLEVPIFDHYRVRRVGIALLPAEADKGRFLSTPLPLHRSFGI